MVKRERFVSDQIKTKFSGITWVKWALVGLVCLVISGLMIKEYQRSQMAGHSQYRFNMAMIVPDSGITFISFDPAEKSVLVIPFPTNLAINSRSKGEYSISSLYKLGSYRDLGGMFARQKIQGFMRVPVPGYMVVANEKGKVKSQLVRGLLGAAFLPKRTDSSLSRFDAIMLFFRASRYGYREVPEEELVRAGVIDESVYHPERLNEYVGSRLFDWGIGAEGVTVAIVNASGENGLGSDMADFLTNLGMDVVMVRSASREEVLEVTEWQVSDDDSALKLGYIFQNLFGFKNPKVENITDEYRSKVLIRVGKDARELF